MSQKCVPSEAWTFSSSSAEGGRRSSELTATDPALPSLHEPIVDVICTDDCEPALNWSLDHIHFFKSPSKLQKVRTS